MGKGFSTCKGCNTSIPSGEAQIYSGKKYCNRCYELKLKDKKEYDELLKAIMYYFNIDVPSGLILKHIKEYKEQFNYTYAGMQYCLWYCKEIKGLRFDIKYGIAIIKYEYENAKDYFLQQQKVLDSVSKINHEEKVREVKVNVKRQEQKKLLINIDELIKVGE